MRTSEFSAMSAVSAEEVMSDESDDLGPKE